MIGLEGIEDSGEGGENATGMSLSEKITSVTESHAKASFVLAACRDKPWAAWLR
jgi:hypothetical protein